MGGQGVFTTKKGGTDKPIQETRGNGSAHEPTVKVRSLGLLAKLCLSTPGRLPPKTNLQKKTGPP